MKRVAVITLGCKTNQFESAAMIEQFAAGGYSVVPFDQPADLYVVNSCTVTARTDAETRRIIRRARRLNPQARIVATGCYAQVAPEELERMPEVDVVLGNLEKLDPALLTMSPRTRVSEAGAATALPPLKLTSFAEHTRAFLQVQNGCNTFCAYCIVPFARGRSRSVPIGEVLDGIKGLVENGFREVVLTGIHLGAYGLDLSAGPTLEELVDQILKQTTLPRLRIGSVDPNEFSEALLAQCSQTPRICKHFHIPLQSGSDTVLERMGRPYDTTGYRQLLQRIAEAMPDAFIGTDIIAGFPGETEAEFEATCRFVESLPLADLHVFPYSKRPRTRAAAMPEQLPPLLIKERAARLRKIAEAKKLDFLDRSVGSQVLVLVQQYDPQSGTVRGISHNYLQAEFRGGPGDINHELRVTVTGHSQGRVQCRLRDA